MMKMIPSNNDESKNKKKFNHKFHKRNENLFSFLNFEMMNENKTSKKKIFSNISQEESSGKDY